MRKSLEYFDKFLNTLEHLENIERDFLSDYVRVASHNIRLDDNQNLNLFDLYNECDSNSYSDFILFLLEKCYIEDNYHFISEICGYCYGNLPPDNRIKEILLKGIWDRSKSNRLRERFFWNFNYGFKDHSIIFFNQELQKFITENQENSELVADVIDFLHWNINSTNSNLDSIRKIVINYLDIKPEAADQIRSSHTKALLSID